MWSIHSIKKCHKKYVVPSWIYVQEKRIANDLHAFEKLLFTVTFGLFWEIHLKFNNFKQNVIFSSIYGIIAKKWKSDLYYSIKVIKVWLSSELLKIDMNQQNLHFTQYIDVTRCLLKKHGRVMLRFIYCLLSYVIERGLQK